MRSPRWSLIFWVALALFVGRFAALYVADVAVRGEPSSRALLRLIGRAQSLQVVALLAGSGAVLIAAWLPRARLWRVAAFCLTALLCFVALSGWGWDAVHPATEPGSLGERLAFAIFALGAIAFAGLVTGTGWSERRTGSSSRELWFSALPIVALAAGPSLLALAWSRRPIAPRLVTLLDLGATGELLNSEQAVVGVVRTRGSWGGSNASLTPALVVEPDTTLCFRVPPELGVTRLVLSAASDLRAHKRLKRQKVAGSMLLDVRVDGTVVASASFAVGMTPASDRPIDVAGPAGLELGSAAELELEVRWQPSTQQSELDQLRMRPRLGFTALRLARADPRVPGIATPKGPNIVLVIHDTLRADRTSAYGYRRPTTPNLERLAARGVLYEQASSPSSWTWPSTASILTGLAVEATGVRDPVACNLADSLETLAEALAPRGYLTAAFIGNPLVARQHGFAQGFDLFSGAGRVFQFSSVVLAEVEAWIAENHGERFFLYLHLVDAHKPYDNRPEFVEQFAAGLTPGSEDLVELAEPVRTDRRKLLSDTYDAGVATGDFYLGRLLDALEEQGLTESTVIAVTSDHGEELLERGFMNHGHGLYAEQTRVPLVIAGPGIPRGERRTQPVAVQHLAPTLARFGGKRLRDLTDPLDLAQATPPAAQLIYLSTHRGFARGGADPHHLIALRRGQHVLHVNASAGATPLGLFDLARDPGETQDLSAELPELTAELTELLLRLEREQREAAPAARVGDAATLEMLRALGYLGADEQVPGTEE